ncbi:RpiR family transcriptional regulator [Lacticaseibacillus brantae DSM 23927]|uniref:RpiR family transcriptional regulator n=1 Tax=Lacticaseibacillus brantae DSM 23927 TaxID=1423727 RepID=A0A0R2AY73_9LACO|nr:RpiR family transcriptional regulator [Lacticaseibacillus brantae DSM 23927]
MLTENAPFFGFTEKIFQEVIMELSPSEAYFWDFVLNHQHQIMNLSITQLSATANVSTATIVRTVKKKGFSGYTDFRHSLFRDEGGAAQFGSLKNVDQQIQQVILQNEEEVTNTIKLMDINVIEDSIQLLKHAKTIYIFARGLSEMIASEMTLKFQLLGKNAQTQNDPNIIKTIANRVTADDVVIFITLNGGTPELVHAAQVLAKKDVSKITLTTNRQGAIIPFSDEIFLGYKSDLSYFQEFEVRSRLPLQVMARVLLDSYVVRTQN